MNTTIEENDPYILDTPEVSETDLIIKDQAKIIEAYQKRWGTISKVLPKNSKHLISKIEVRYPIL